MIRYILIVTASFFLFNGCSVGPEYNPPFAVTPKNWKNPHEENCSYPEKECWWEVFEDSVLDSLIQEALFNNYNLKMAFERVEEARALMDVAKADLYPQLFLNSYYNNAGELYESYSDGVIVRAHEVLYLLPLNLSYEVDLWGKIRSRYQAAIYNWEGQIDAYHSILLILTTDLAIVYYQLRTLDAEIDLLEATIAAREKALKINQSRFQAKIIDYIDVTRAALEVTTTLAKLRETIRLRAELENRLAVLIGVPSSEFHFDHNPLQGIPPAIPAGIPSEVLIRRPDILEAERTIARENALVRVAYASFFPSLTLTGGLGSSSPHLRYFLKPKGRLWEFGGYGSQMVFDGGRLEGDLVFQKMRFNEASAAYQQQVLICFQEVEDALSNIENYGKEFDDMAASLDWAKKTYRIANNRYNSGVTFYLDVVISEQDVLSNEIALNNLRGVRFASTIHLIKALGGGW